MNSVTNWSNDVSRSVPSIVSSKLIDIEESLVEGKSSKTPDDLELLENYRENSDLIEKMKPIMFLLKLNQ